MVVTEKDLKLYFRCQYSYFLHKIGVNNPELNAFGAAKMLFLNERKKVFYVKDSRRSLLIPNRAGLESKLAEEMTREELERYGRIKLSGRLFGKWLAIVKKGEYMGKRIRMNFEKQEFVIGNNLKKAGENYVAFMLEEGAPITGYVEKDVAVEYKEMTFRVRFPEIRKGRIDDVGLWGFNSDLPKERKRIDKSALVTLRVAAYKQLLEKEFYRRRFGDFKEYRHFNASANEIEIVEDFNFEYLDEMIERFKEGGEEPNLKKCGNCDYGFVCKNKN